jgi:hypothetical protein
VVDSSSSALYLDCGEGSYLGTGKSWCDPFKSWQDIYLHEPSQGNHATPDRDSD